MEEVGRAVASRVGMNDERCARGECGEDLVERAIEVQGKDVEGAVTGLEVCLRHHGVDAVDDGSVFDDGTFRLSGRT